MLSLYATSVNFLFNQSRLCKIIVSRLGYNVVYIGAVGKKTWDADRFLLAVIVSVFKASPRLHIGTVRVFKLGTIRLSRILIFFLSYQFGLYTLKLSTH